MAELDETSDWNTLIAFNVRERERLDRRIQKLLILSAGGHLSGCRAPDCDGPCGCPSLRDFAQELEKAKQD